MAFCVSCGSEIPDDAAFCAKCGHPVSKDTQQAQPQTVPAVQAAPAALQNLSPMPTGVPWEGAIVLQDGEGFQRYWTADHEISTMGVVNGQTQMVKERQGGFLVLTNQRIIFVKARGVFSKSYHPDITFQLEALDGVTMGGLVMKYVSISSPTGENIFHVKGVGNEVEFSSFRGMVFEQISQRQQSLAADKRRDRVQIVLDFGDLRDYMSRGGLSLQVVKCPQCGAAISLPSEGSVTKCDHCGATVYAQDIMEKVKELIG